MYDEQGRRNTLASATALAMEPSRSEDLEQTFRDYHALVFRAAYRVTGNLNDAEDVLQTVFLRLARREADAAALEKVESYLYRAAVNCALDLVRSRQNLHCVSLEDAAPCLVDESSLAPDRAHASGELRSWLRGAIARLSPRAAEIFVLRFFEEKDNPEIARILGTTEGTVAVTLSRTRDRIHREFRAYMGEKS